MRFRSHPTRTLFDFLELPADRAHEQLGALRAMYEKRMDGLILRGLYPPEAMALVAERLASFSLHSLAANVPQTLGRSIVGEAPDLQAYFEDAQQQRVRLRALFSGLGDFEETLVRVFAALTGGLRARLVPGPDGRLATPATVRVMNEGHEIGVHADNEFALMPHAEHLHANLDLSDQLSFFMPISVPEAGGELIVYGLEHADVAHMMPASGAGNTWMEGTAVYDVVSRMDGTAFTPGPGDMLIFDGGRYFHRVTKVVGSTPRRTIGGFLGFSRGGDEVLFWS